MLPEQTITHQNGTKPELTLRGLSPMPQDTWRMMREFSGPTEPELHAMRQTVDAIFQRGYEMVVATYDYLQRNPETARILGWETRADEKHLAERRRFFTIWLARTLSVDLGDDYAWYLFRSGQVHAAHGPRQIHTPSMWVTGSMGLVLSAFAEYIRAEHDDADVVAHALTGWNKYLLMQLNQMQTGYQAALELDGGPVAIPVTMLSLLRQRVGRPLITVHVPQGASATDVLVKLLNYVPQMRDLSFERSWEDGVDEESAWPHLERIYSLRPGWRVLLNGKDLPYHGGFGQEVRAGDEMLLAPPGR
jgi:hypothetical protein